MRIPTPAQTSRIVWMLSIFLLFHVSRAAPIPTTSSIPRPAPAAAAPIAPSGPDLLWYQVCSCSSFASNSQNYEPANDAFDNQLADDFYVQPGVIWTVQLVYVEGRYFQGTTGPVPSVNVFFYFDSGNFPGAPVPGGTFLDVGVTDVDGTLTINLPSGVVLTEGGYWVSVQANLNLATNGRWGWDDGIFPPTFGSAYRNPGGGFGGSCTSWGRRADCFGTPDPDQSFALGGTVSGGPTPSPSPSPSPSSTPGATPTPTPTPSAAKALNISTRLRIETGDNVLIGGFIIGGNAPKNVAMRGIGPSLVPVGITDALADPILELRAANGALLAQNDDWQDDPAQAAQLTALGLALQDPKESGLIATLQPGASSTAILAGNSGGTGVGLVEIYDTNQEADSQLANISTRGFVQTGNNVMIGGFILGGSSNNTRIVVRGIGPSLALIGLNPVLADPTLELRDSNGALLISNDDWQDDPVSASQLTSHGLAPQNPDESGIFASLPPGAFTAILAGNNGGTGIGLVEIYNVQ